MKFNRNLIISSLRNIALALVILILFTPLIVLVIYSFSEKGFPYSFGKVTGNWYIALFEESELWVSFFNSLFIAITSSLICAVITLFMLAYQFYGGCIKRVVPLFYSNLIIPEIILAVSLLSFFTHLNLELGIKTIIIAHTLIGLGLCIPILYNRYCDIDENTIEASYSLGATKLQTFFRIILPIMRPSISTSCIFIFILSFDDFILSYFVSSQSTQTISLYLISCLRTGISPSVNALSLLLLVTTIAIFSIFFKRNRVRDII